MEERKEDRKNNDVMVIEEEEKQVNRSRQTMKQQTDRSGFFIFLYSRFYLKALGKKKKAQHIHTP